MHLLVASEYSDPCFHINTVVNKLVEVAFSDKIPRLLLITKNIGACEQILKVCKDYDIPKIVHVTCTGLGKTVFEPQVPYWFTVLATTRKLLHDGLLDKKTTILRMDPLLVAGSKQHFILHNFSLLGITQIRTSIVDNYKHVLERYKNAGFTDVTTRFHETADLRIARLKELSKNAEKFGMSIDICAEGIDPKLIGNNVTIKGCASIEEWDNLGYPVDKEVRHQRKLCTCDAYKEDILAGLEKGCNHKCLYCYWK